MNLDPPPHACYSSSLTFPQKPCLHAVDRHQLSQHVSSPLRKTKEQPLIPCDFHLCFDCVQCCEAQLMGPPSYLAPLQHSTSLAISHHCGLLAAGKKIQQSFWGKSATKRPVPLSHVRQQVPRTKPVHMTRPQRTLSSPLAKP